MSRAGQYAAVLQEHPAGAALGAADELAPPHPDLVLARALEADEAAHLLARLAFRDVRLDPQAFVPEGKMDQLLRWATSQANRQSSFQVDIFKDSHHGRILR